MLTRGYGTGLIVSHGLGGGISLAVPATFPVTGARGRMIRSVEGQWFEAMDEDDEEVLICII